MTEYESVAWNLLFRQNLKHIRAVSDNHTDLSQTDLSPIGVSSSSKGSNVSVFMRFGRRSSSSLEEPTSFRIFRTGRVVVQCGKFCSTSTKYRLPLASSLVSVYNGSVISPT